MVRMLRQTTLFLLLFLTTAGLADAQSDPRMSVHVDFEAGRSLSLNEAIRKALPVLWDRIIVRDARAAVPSGAAGTPLLQRAVPVDNGMLVEFDPRRTFEYLKQNNIEYIAQQPKFQLLIRLWNQNGAEMAQTAHLLQQEAAALAQRQGVALEDDAPALVLNWRWLDATTVNLLTRGNTALPESSETREFNRGDPLDQLRGWMADIIIAARDADGRFRAQAGSDEAASAGKVRTAAGIEAILTVDVPATLAEQVILEDALARHPRVAAVVPKFLSHDSRQYLLRLKGDDDKWVPAWFKRRGMEVFSTPQGWQVR